MNSEPMRHENDTMTITELITAIRVWQKANDEYLAALAESPEHGTRKRQEAIATTDQAARLVTNQYHNDTALAAFVALADEVEQLEAQVKRLSKTADLDEGYIEFLERKDSE